MSYVIVSAKKKGSAVVEFKSAASAVSILSHDIIFLVYPHWKQYNVYKECSIDQ